jgi:hypothetical protein
LTTFPTLCFFPRSPGTPFSPPSCVLRPPLLFFGFPLTSPFPPLLSVSLPFLMQSAPLGWLFFLPSQSHCPR